MKMHVAPRIQENSDAFHEQALSMPLQFGCHALIYNFFKHCSSLVLAAALSLHRAIESRQRSRTLNICTCSAVAG